MLDILDDRTTFYTNTPPKAMRSHAFRLVDSDAVIECARTVDVVDRAVAVYRGSTSPASTDSRSKLTGPSSWS